MPPNTGAPTPAQASIKFSWGEHWRFPGERIGRPSMSRVPAESKKNAAADFLSPPGVATSGPSGTGPARQLREDFAIKRRMRLPRLRRYDPPVAHGLLIDKRSAGLLRFQADVLIAGHSFASRQPGRRQNLDPVADGEDPFL